MSRSRLYTDRNFMLLWSGNALSLTGFHGVRIAYPMLVLAVTGSPVAAGWAGFALSIPGLIFQIPAGMVADRADRLRILQLCQVLGLAGTCLAAAAASARPPGLGLILAGTAFVEGSAYVFVSLSELGMVRDLVSVEQRPAAFSFLEAQQSIANLVGRATGAAMYGVTRWLPFIANAASYLYCLAALSRIRSKSAASRESAESTGRTNGRDIAAGMRIVWADPLLRTSTLLIGASNVVIQVVLLLILVELKTNGRPAWVAGVVLGMSGVGGMLGAVMGTWITARFSAERAYRGALWMWTALLVPIALSANPILLAMSWGGIGGVTVASYIALTVYRVSVIPEQVLGRALGTISLVSEGAVALGALGAGYLVSTLGIVATRWAMLAAMLVLAVRGSTVTPTPSPEMAVGRAR
ncbi:MFS transporter [Nocardia sp. NBC_01730]|uniref:MFS transporter n=1 Tax=Nocardia sp. NBC_01730 TaxID=2975998 RepID=UPI002E12E76D|nr:MFS transporter [Nocardia sp. NBC_01730]